MYGYVSVRAFSSRSSASHSTRLLELTAPSWTLRSPRYVLLPVPFEMDLEVMREEVLGAAWTILPPASWCCPSPAYATERISPRAPSPIRYTAGYFIVSLEPRFPSTHSTVAFSSATARLVTRL